MTDPLDQTWADGAEGGTPLSAERLNAMVDAINAGIAAANTPAGSPVVRKFPFAFDTPNILTGAALYTPTVGDILLNAWAEVGTAWDGTDVVMGMGLFLPGYPDYGYWSVADISIASPVDTGVVVTQPGAPVRMRFLSTDPVKVKTGQVDPVSGAFTGVDPSTQGAAILYLVTATPV